MNIECTVISSEEGMKKIADEMIEFSNENPFDEKGAMRSALIGEQAGIVKVEEFEKMTRIKSNKPIPGVDQYNRYIVVEDRCLQLSYFQYSEIVQLTIVDMHKNPIEPGLCLDLAEFFINVDERVMEQKTPEHVRVLFQNKTSI